MAGKPQSGGTSPTEQPLGLGQTVVAGLAEGLLDLGVVKVCWKKKAILIWFYSGLLIHIDIFF